jgi:hypothetical protein
VSHYLEANLSLSDKIYSYIKFLKTYFTFINLYRKRYRNFLSVISCVLRNNYPIKAVHRNGNIVQLGDYQEVYNDLTELDADSNRDIVYFNELRFHGGKSNGDILNIFKKNEYSFLQVKGKEVIDVGANIGDSSIYFADRGATSIIAVEPDKISYDYAVENIAINGYSSKIKLILGGCGSKDSIASENDPQFLTLKTLIKKYCTRPEILKVDCEGCEYDFIMNASFDDLSRFSYIQIEYHFGYQNLKRRLEACDFEVTCTRPSFFIPLNKNRMTSLVQDGSVSQSNTMFIGWLYATNKELRVQRG